MAFNDNSNSPRSKPGQMPSPPEFLTRPHPTEEIAYPPAIEEHVPPAMPKNIDYGLYQSVLNDRRQAEISYAEIYSQYVEMVSFNQKLLKEKQIFERFCRRVREVYDRALQKDGKQSEEVLRARRHQEAVEKAYNELQIESESLRASNKAHEDAFQKILIKLGQAEAQFEQANHQFQTIAEEFDNRGILLEEADRHIQGYRTEVKQLTESLKEWQDKYAMQRDENAIMRSEVKEVQMKEAGFASLNNELTMSMTKAQKQIFELEDKLMREREEFKSRMALAESELEHYREQRRVEALLEKSKKAQSGESLEYGPGEVIKPTTDSEESRVQWNEFYNRWSHIINELTSQSTMIGKTTTLPPIPTETQPVPELVSEAGELEII